MHLLIIMLLALAVYPHQPINPSRRIPPSDPRGPHYLTVPVEPNRLAHRR